MRRRIAFSSRDASAQEVRAQFCFGLGAGKSEAPRGETLLARPSGPCTVRRTPQGHTRALFKVGAEDKESMNLEHALPSRGFASNE